MGDSMKRNNEPSKRFLRDSGVKPGMRVLELGCGMGEISKILSSIVGSEGSVFAVDQNKEMIETVSRSFEQGATKNVQFAQADLNVGPEFLQRFDKSSFDVITGRRVLMYLSDPTQVLKMVMPWLKEGGLVVFEEIDMTMCPASSSPMPSHTKGVSWIGSLMKREQANCFIGLQLPSIYSAAGLINKKMWAETVIEGQGDQFPLSDMMELLKPRLISAGIASASQIESLKQGILQECQSESIFISGMRFCVSAIKPAL